MYQININELEALSKIKIRNGFEKWLKKTLEYFNFDIIDCEKAKKIVLFINSSNSKLSESYWILRRNLTKEEFYKQKNNAINLFINSAYKNTNRRKVTKNFIKKNVSRGYSGYITIRNEKIFCRSKAEFIYFHYFDLTLDKKYKIKSEEKIFYVQDFSYKPDIFIYSDENILIKIIEIKSSKNDIIEKYQKFNEYFKSLNIDFEILFDANTILKQYPNIKTDLKFWIETQAKIQRDMKGKNNPRFGSKCSEKTKKLIGEKCKKRNEDKEYRKKCSEATKTAFNNNPNYRKKLSQKALINAPKTYKNRILKYFSIFNLDIISNYNDFLIQLKQLKNDNLIPKRFSMSERVIDKYFGSFDQLKEQYENYKNNKAN